MQDATFFELIEYKRQLEGRLQERRQAIKSDGTLESLRALSEDIRNFSKLNRQIAQDIRSLSKSQKTQRDMIWTRSLETQNHLG